jgi:hypothetical protein
VFGVRCGYNGDRQQDLCVFELALDNSVLCCPVAFLCKCLL